MNTVESTGHKIFKSVSSNVYLFNNLVSSSLIFPLQFHYLSDTKTAQCDTVTGCLSGRVRRIKMGTKVAFLHLLVFFAVAKANIEKLHCPSHVERFSSKISRGHFYQCKFPFTNKLYVL